MLQGEGGASQERETAAGLPPEGAALRRLRGAADWMARHSRSLEHRGLWLFVALSGLYWLITPALAARKLMWNDELYTYYVARLPSMRDVWAALMSGGEQTPPLFYLTTRIAFDLFGVNNISVRLPAMLGFWVMSACLLVYVKRRTSWFPALAAAAFPLVTTAYQYAFEARAYGMVLGFSGIALVAWQTAAHGRRRGLSLLCLAASLSAAVSTHYYALFLMIPLALGEATRTLVSRRLNLHVWAAFAVPAVALALHLPLIRASQAYSGAFWSPPQWLQIPAFYDLLLAPAVVPAVLVVVLTAIHWALAGDEATPAIRGADAAPPAAEIVAACGLSLIPFVCVVVAKVATGAFTDRYAIPAVLGVAVLIGFASAAAFRRSPLMRAVTLACLVCWFALSQAREFVEPTGLSLPVDHTTIDRPAAWLKTNSNAELPVVVADPHTFTVLSHYGLDDLKARIVYLADANLALKHLGHNSVERGMLDLLRPWFRMNVVEFEPFIAEHPQFLIYGDFFRMEFLNWMTPELRHRGMRLELLNREGNNLLLLASRGATRAGLGPTAQPLRGR